MYESGIGIWDLEISWKYPTASPGRREDYGRMNRVCIWGTKKIKWCKILPRLLRKDPSPSHYTDEGKCRDSRHVKGTKNRRSPVLSALWVILAVKIDIVTTWKHDMTCAMFGPNYWTNGVQCIPAASPSFFSYFLHQGVHYFFLTVWIHLFGIINTVDHFCTLLPGVCINAVPPALCYSSHYSLQTALFLHHTALHFPLLKIWMPYMS